MDDNDADVLDTPPTTISEVVYAPEPEKIETSASDKPVDVKSESDLFNVTASQEETRATIALYFTRAFLVLVGIALATPFIINFGLPSVIPDPLAAAKELVTVLASVLAGPFGFIVGFYFKQGNDQ